MFWLTRGATRNRRAGVIDFTLSVGFPKRFALVVVGDDRPGCLVGAGGDVVGGPQARTEVPGLARKERREQGTARRARAREGGLFRMGVM